MVLSFQCFQNPINIRHKLKKMKVKLSKDIGLINTSVKGLYKKCFNLLYIIPLIHILYKKAGII